MNPAFDKNGALMPMESMTNITRSFDFKLGLPGFSSAGFFCSRGGQVPASQAEEASRAAYEFCYSEVVAAVQEYKRALAQMAQEVLQPSQSVAAKPVEANPFQVTARPSPPTDAALEEKGNKPESLIPNSGIPPAEVDNVQAGQNSSPETNKIAADPAKELLTEVTGSGLVPPVTPPARRGRKAKEQPDILPAAGSDEAKHLNDNPLMAAITKNPASGSFQASDEDLPANMGGTHEPSPGPDMKERTREFIQGQDTQIPANGPVERSKEESRNLLSQQTGPQLVPPPADPGERVNAAVARIAAETKKDPTKVKDMAKEFFRAFLNIKGPLPKLTDEAYKFAIPIFESLAGKYAANIVADPQSMGLEAGVGWNKLQKHIDRWPEAIKHLAMRVAIKRYSDNAHDLLDFLHETAKLGALDNELLIFLTTFYNFDAATSMALKEAAAQQSKKMADIVAGLDLVTCGQAALLSRMSGVDPVAKSIPGIGADLWPE